MSVGAKTEKTVVVGFGWVGQANALALARMGFEVAYFDVVTPPHHYTDRYGLLYEKIKPLGSLLEIDGPNTWYVVCIGDRVSEEGVQDISLIEKVLESLKTSRGKIVLRFCRIIYRGCGLICTFPNFYTNFTLLKNV